VVQLQACGLHAVARQNVLSGPRKNSEKKSKFETCWKACEVTFASLNCLRWRKFICRRATNNTISVKHYCFCFIYFFCDHIRWYGPPLTLRWSTSLYNLCVFLQSGVHWLEKYIWRNYSIPPNKSVYPSVKHDILKLALEPN